MHLICHVSHMVIYVCYASLSAVVSQQNKSLGEIKSVKPLLFKQ